MATETSSDTKRLLEIIKTISRFKPAQGLTPQKLCEILRALGPTFVKLGQLLSMHPEIVPEEYCRELESLRTDASQLVTAQMYDVLTAEYGKPWNKVFSRILPIPVGSASIAQVHEAYLLDGTHVAIKIQRPDIYETMERDTRLLKRAVGIVKFKSISSVMDIGSTLDEVWNAAKEEMDFEREADNIEQLRRNIEGIEYVYCPKVFRELSTKNVLVMEYIGGCELNDLETLKAEGYDISEVCTKFINNYIKQFSEDRFFHADPHPGNIHVENGRVVWLDLGMMGYLSEKDAELVKVCMRTIFTGDSRGFGDTVLQICEHDADMDMDDYYARMKAYIKKYRVISMADMSSSIDIFKDLYDICCIFNIQVPKSMTMFWRSMSIMEGTVSALAPDTDLAAIIGKHMAAIALGSGIAGSIARSKAHKHLISGSALSYNGHIAEDREDSEYSEAELDELIRQEFGGNN